MLKIIKKPAAAEVEKQAEEVSATKNEPKKGQSSVSELKSFEPLPPKCVVSITVGYTHKLPSEDWIKTEIRLDVPAEYKDIDSVYDYIKEWTDAKLNAFVSEVTGG